MQGPAVVTVPPTDVVKAFRATTNANMALLATAITNRVGAWQEVNDVDDLVNLVDATYLDFATTLDGNLCVLTGTDPTIIENWRILDADPTEETAPGVMLSVADLGVLPNTGVDQRGPIIAAIEFADGRPLYFPSGVYLKDGAGIPIPSNADLTLAPDAIIRNMPGADAPVLVNSDLINGNTNITIRGGLFDGNRAQADTGFYSTIDFTKVTFSLFDNISVRGAARPVQQEGGNGEGMVFRAGGWNEVRGGHFYENDYDGLKLRGSHHNTIHGTRFTDNERSAVQISYQSDSYPGPINLTSAARNNTITGCTVTHSTGVVGTGAPDAGTGASYNSGFGFHGCTNNTLTGNTVYGTGCGIDILEGADRNVISGNTFQCRPTTAEQNAIINIWYYNNSVVLNNQIVGNLIYGLAGASKRYIRVDGASTTLIANNQIGRDASTTSGTWTIESTTNSGSTKWLNNTVDANAVTVSLLETAPIELWYVSGNLGLNTRLETISGRGVLALRNASIVPSANWANGGQLYAEAGALKWRGSSGTITTLALP